MSNHKVWQYNVVKDYANTIREQAKIIRKQRMYVVFLSGCLVLSVLIIFMLAVRI